MSFICVICRDVLKSSGSREEFKGDNQFTIVSTKCGHLFHFPCLSNWFHQSWKTSDSDSKPRCPTCKTLSYVHELVRVYPAQESTSTSITGAITLCADSPSDTDSLDAVSHLSNSLATIRNDYKELEAQFHIVSNAVENNNARVVNDKPMTCMEMLGMDLKKLQYDFEALSMLCKSSKVKWESQREKQRQEIVFLKRQNEKLIKENKCQIPGRNQEGNSGDDSIITRMSLKDELEDYRGDYFAHCGTSNEPLEWVMQNDSNSQHGLSAKIGNEDYSIRLGDKIVWILNEKPETGVVKWKGFVGSRIYAGIEFEHQLGIPIGDVHTDSLQYIFNFKAGHGRLVPVQELTLYQQFYSDGESKRKSRKLSLQRLKLHSCSQQ